jgi:hypothetical protein
MTHRREAPFRSYQLDNLNREPIPYYQDMSNTNIAIKEGISRLVRSNVKAERLFAKAQHSGVTTEVKRQVDSSNRQVRELISQMSHKDSSADRARLLKQFDDEFKRTRALCQDLDNLERSRAQPAANHTSDTQSGYQQEQNVVDEEVVFLRFDDSEIKDRHVTIRQIETDTIQLLEAYQDFRMLVDHQQTALDTLDSNVSNAKERVLDAHSELLEADESAQKGRRRRMCCIGLVLLVILVISLVVWIISN